MGLTAQNTEGTSPASPRSTLHATHILGFEGIANNATGEISIQEHALRFQKGAASSGQTSIGQISVSSIENLFLGEEDKQVGGTTMAVGRAAAPYGGGRVIALFSHKKYDTLTLEYLDPDGRFHGAIFQLDKGEGSVLKNELAAEGTHVADAKDPAITEVTTEVRNVGAWSVEVERVDPGDVNIEPAFRVAIYENLLDELAKTKQFKHVFRSGDRNAGGPDLLILKTRVQKYTPGSETRRAVTTVSGATKLNVRSQLCTPDGQVVLERMVDGNVRFFGGNLRATHNLAHNVADSFKKSTLPARPLSSRE